MLMENLVAIEETSALYLIINGRLDWPSGRVYFEKPRARLLILCLYFYLPSDRYKIPDEQNATLDSEGKKSRPITTTFNKTPGEREKTETGKGVF